MKTKIERFEAREAAVPALKQPTQRRRVVRMLAAFTHGIRHFFGLALLMLIFESTTAVFEAYPLAYLIDFLSGKNARSLPFPGLTSQRASTVAVLTLAIVVLAAINSACDSMAEIYLARGGRTLGYNLRVALYSHLQKLSLAFHNQRRTGDVLTRVTGDVQAVEEFIVNSLSDIAGSILVLIGTLAFLFYKSWRVALMALVLVPLLSVVAQYFSKRIKVTARKQRAREGDLASEAQEMLSAIRVIQTYGAGGREQRKFADASKKAYGAAVETAGLEARFSFVVSVMEALIISAVVWLGLLLINTGQVTVGTLVLFVILIQNMFKPTRRIIKEFATIGKTYASVERIGELLDRLPPVTDLPGAIPAPSLRGEIELRDVSFAYLPDAEDVAKDSPDEPVRLALQRISFRVGPGEVLALVGPSGAGKSTIAQLIPRLYDPQRGEVLIDGTDIRGFTLNSLRSQIGMVLQETILFTGSVAHNIAYGREEATQEEIVGAAKMANAHDFIMMMPNGYDTDLSERAANLSGGQRQRIAIARALIRNAPVLMLDEPTTGLDPEASSAVLEALHRLMSGKTTIIISHDLKLIRSADRIVVVKGGRIEEMGTHDQLMARDGLYASLHARQFGEPDRPPATADERAAEDEEEFRGSVFQTLLMEALPVPAQPHALDRALGVEAAGPGDGARSPRSTGGDALGSPPEPAGDRSLPKLSQRPGTPPQPGPSARSRTIFKTMVLPVIRRGQQAAPEAPGRWPIDASLLDARRSLEVLRRFPAIETIFDGAAMADRLQAAMVDGQRYVVERCAVGQALFLGGDECTLRYHLEMRERGTGRAERALLSARLFADAARSHLHLGQRLAPLASRVRQREESSCFSSPVTSLDDLNMTVHTFPIDPDLPHLVEATEPHFMADLLRRTLPGATVGGALQECQVEVAHYPRRYRCVLRYLVRGERAGVDGSIVVYGKTYAEGQTIPDPDALKVLREAVLANPRGVRVTMPGYAGLVSQMQLLLLEGIQGSPDIGRMIRGHAQGGDDAALSGLALRESIVACGATAATLHTSGAALGPIRTLEDDLAHLHAELTILKRISPDLAARLEEEMAGLVEAASGSRAGPLCLSHGDFTYTQALFQGQDVGIVDLDNVCRAEPALDLGQFVAYLRVAVRKACDAASRPYEALSSELCDLFLSSYEDSSHIQDTDGLADRVRVHERLSLLRMVVRSWQQLKPARAANALAVLQERSHP